MQLKDRTFVLIDTETTGFDKEKHQLLEVGMLVIKDLKVVDKLELKIKHKEYVVTAGAMSANKIDLLEHDKEGVEPQTACYEIMSFLRNNMDFTEEKGSAFIPIGQNIDFDLGFLEQLFLKNYKIKDYRLCMSYRKLDIMQVALVKSLEGKIELDSQSLDSLLEALNIDIPEDRHRAMVDCYLEFEVLNRLLGL